MYSILTQQVFISLSLAIHLYLSAQTDFSLYFAGKVLTYLSLPKDYCLGLILNFQQPISPKYTHGGGRDIHTVLSYQQYSN